MAEVIANEEMFFTASEPKTQNRFIMYMDGVPDISSRVLLVLHLTLMLTPSTTSTSKERFVVVKQNGKI